MSVDDFIEIIPGFIVTFPQEERFGDDFKGLTFHTGLDSHGRRYILSSYENFPNNRVPRQRLTELTGIHLSYVKAYEKKAILQHYSSTA